MRKGWERCVCEWQGNKWSFQKGKGMRDACARTMDGSLDKKAFRRERIRPCLVFLQKNFAKESYQFEVLNEIYLQIFLHRWVVKRETNLMMLINP